MWPVQGAAEAQGWGWQTVEVCGVEGLPLEAWLKVSGLEELGRMWVVGQAGRRSLGDQAGKAQRGRVQGRGVWELWPALDCRVVGVSYHS